MKITSNIMSPITITGRITPSFTVNSGTNDYIVETYKIENSFSENNTYEQEYTYITLNTLTFDGTQFVLLNIAPKNTTRVEAVFKRSTTSDYAFVIGSRSTDSADNGLALAYNSSNCYPIFGSARSSISGAAAVNTVHTVVLGQDGYYLGVQRIKTYDSMNFTGVYPLCVGSINTGGNIDNRRFQGEIYSINIYDSDVLQASLIPVVRVSDSAVGLFDLVSSTFYEQTGVEET